MSRSPVSPPIKISRNSADLFFNQNGPSITVPCADFNFYHSGRWWKTCESSLCQYTQPRPVLLICQKTCQSLPFNIIFSTCPSSFLKLSSSSSFLDLINYTVPRGSEAETPVICILSVITSPLNNTFILILQTIVPHRRRSYVTELSKTSPTLTRKRHCPIGPNATERCTEPDIPLPHANPGIQHRTSSLRSRQEPVREGLSTSFRRRPKVGGRVIKIIKYSAASPSLDQTIILVTLELFVIFFTNSNKGDHVWLPGMFENTYLLVDYQSVFTATKELFHRAHSFARESARQNFKEAALYALKSEMRVPLQAPRAGLRIN